MFCNKQQNSTFIFAEGWRDSVLGASRRLLVTLGSLSRDSSPCPARVSHHDCLSFVGKLVGKGRFNKLTRANNSSEEKGKEIAIFKSKLPIFLNFRNFKLNSINSSSLRTNYKFSSLFAVIL